MVDNQFLSNNFWSKKIRHKDASVFSKKEVNILKIEIFKNDLKDFIKISKNNPLSKFTIISSIFSFLLKKYFSNFQNTIKIYPSNLLDLEKYILLEVRDNDTATFKDLLQAAANEIKETFSYKDYNPLELNLDSFSNYSIQFGQKVSDIKDNISLLYEETDDKLILTVYHQEINKEYLIESLLNNFRDILSDYESVLNQEINFYSLADLKTREQILLNFNATDVFYPDDETIVDLFEKQVEKTPEDTALVYEGVRLTYKELNEESNFLAYYLIDTYNIQGDDLICIKLPRSEKMIIAILGILKSGGAYVPIDTEYPKERIDYILEDTRCKVLIDESFWRSYESLKGECSKDNPPSVISPNDLAYIIYTSGTTGNPKGVMIEHRNVFNSTMNRVTFYSIESMLLIPSFSFDSSVAVIFGVLCSGGRLFIEDNNKVKDVEYISSRIIKYNIEGILCVPNYYSNLLPYLNENDAGKNNLKHVIVAGEELVKNLVLNHQKHSEAILYNEYGPTECSVWSTVSIVTNTNVNIGKPISNIQIYILDENRHLLPIGVVGELYIAGAGLARGYLNLPDLTSEKFVANPFVPGTKMYRTGDLGRWLPDGNIEYLGRIDHQVKIRGHRIELGEIDSHVLSYSDSIKSVVTEVKDHEEDKSLVVYYVSGSNIDKHDLSRYLAGKLPQYMLPGFYVALESMPLTSNGKIDRKMLPEVSSTDLIKTEYIAPRTSEEHALVSVFEQVLKYNPISIRDNYYNLGGDSIKSIQIVSKLRQHRYSLKVEDILQHPVLEDLARYITTDVVEIDQLAVTGSVVLTPIQIYFFDSKEFINKNYYNQSVILKSEQRLSNSVLESSIQALVNHHDALRIIYSQEDGKWNQYNAGTEDNHYHFEYFDVREEDSIENEWVSLQKIGDRLQSTINIESGILFHVGHVSMSDGDRVLLIIHHLVVDGVSWRILLDDLTSLYESKIKGASYELPSKTDSFQSWGKALDEYSRSSELSQEHLYWEGVESEVYPDIPTDHPVTGKHILDNSISFSLNEESTKLLQTHAGKKYGAKINDVLLTGLALSLQDHFGINKTKVLMEGHGREVMNTGLDISRTVGWFTSLYPFSLDISNNSQPALVSVKEGLRGIPNKGIGYGILNYLGDSFSPKNNPSIQFNYLGDFDDEMGSVFYYSSEPIGNPISEENLETDIILDVSGITISGEMNISVRYSGDLFNEATVQKLMDSYRGYLEKMISEEESEVILTPSDVTYKGLSFSVLSGFKDVEDVYELSPMQQGLYYHWMVDPKGSAYFMQTSYRIRSAHFNISNIKEAFSILINRYTILRTSFDNRYGGTPLQIVHKKARVDFRHLILEEKDFAEKELERIKKEDISQGFLLDEPSQIRLLVIESSEGEYEFIWSHHHIIMDGWCLSILINDFTSILQSLEQSLEINLPEPKKYSSYIKWLGEIDKEASLKYWESYLKEVNSPTLALFEKEIHEGKPSFITEKFTIDKERFSQINQFCQHLGITLNTYIQAVWAYLLSIHNTSDEVVFGAVVSGRPPEIDDIESMVGLFINTIPVHVAINKEDTPRSLLDKLHRDSIQSTGYHFNSLSQIQSFSPLGTSLINSIIVFENYVKNELKENSMENLNVFDQSNYNFTLVVEPNDDHLNIDFEYNTSVYYSSSIDALISHFKNVLHQFNACADVPLTELDYISPDEKSELLEAFNNTGLSYPLEDTTVLTLFENAVAAKSGSTSVIYGNTSLSYSELNERSNQLAHYLIEKYSIQGDDLICIKLPRSEKLVISILGILKSGGAYVPIDMGYPQDRIDYILQDSGAKVIIDESFLSDFETVKTNYPKENPAVVILPENLAYTIYTSGTTGNPKGVMITHSNIMNYVLWSNSFYFNEGERGNWGLFTSVSFDLSVTALFCSLSRGEKLFLGGNEDDILQTVIKSLENEEIDILKLTPSHISLLKNVSVKESKIRKIILGGEKLHSDHIQTILSIRGDIEIYDEYGPTESTVGCIARKVDTSTITIGKPIANTKIYILNAHSHLVPVGVSGEVYISGFGLARGYLNQEGLTAEKFVDNPFIPGTRMYRTGDLGRWLPDGNIEYLGRIDHQVKIRGHRIELGEIDSHVLSFSDSIRNVVTEVKDDDGDKSLVVYYVSNSSIDKKDLSQYLESKLPQYMLPSYYVELENIPLTSNGKVDRNSLLKILSSDLIKNEYVAPTTLEEQILTTICEEVLKHSPISIKDNFYNLGGDSIKSIQIVSRLRKHGYTLKVKHILKHPVLEELAHFVTAHIVPADQSVVAGNSILTPIQRYFFESKDIADKNYFNQSIILKSSERVSKSVLEQSVKKLVGHHDALRMVYSKKEGKWTQAQSNDSGNHFTLHFHDLRDEQVSPAEELIHLQKIGETLQNTINIESGILLQTGLVSMTGGDRIILVIHHLVVDGVSWRILLEDLGNLYEFGMKGASYELPSKTDSFQNWGKALEDYSKSTLLSKERAYWESVESETYDPIITDYPLNGKHILEKSLGFSLSTESTKLLQTHAGKEYGAEINDLLLTGLALSLQKQFNISRTKILIEGHGRETMNTGLDISRTVGWFTSLYPFSLDISDESQPAIVSIKEGLRAIPNKGIGYGILNYLGDSFSPKDNPSILFNYLGDFDDAIGSAFNYSSESIGNPVSQENLGTDVVLDVSGMTISGEMNITIRYSGDIFNEATVQKLIDSYQLHLEKMISKDKGSVILTPSDLTYNGLSFNTLSEISKSYEVEDIYELSPMQQGLYYHWMVNPKGSTYFMQTSYKVRSILDLSLVEKAFGILVNRYTILRTSFENQYGEVPLQIVHKKAHVNFKYLTLESEFELDHIKQVDIDDGFILSDPTQIRLLLVELPDGVYEFVWSYHHIIMDGWCLSILINDFSTILNNLQKGTEISLPEPQKYANYIQWLEEIDKDSAILYWEDYLKGFVTPTLIPFEKEIKDDQPHFVTEKLSIAGDEFSKINQLCQRLGITLNTYVQAAWSYLLSSYNGSEEIVFGAVVSGRPPEMEEIESMVGLFINTIPVRIAVNGADTPHQLLEKVHQDSIQSSGYHFNSLSQIQSLSPLGKDLISNIVIFENYVKGELNENYENVRVFDQSNYDFTLVVEPSGNLLNIDMEYNASVYSSSVGSLLLHFKEVLNWFNRFINSPLSELEYLSTGDRKVLLKDFNSTEVDYPSNTTIISLFEEQAALTPGTIALVYENTILTYEELDILANNLAYKLKADYEIKKGDYVGVMIDRGVNQIVSILGILKLGAVYVPIDANLPETRKSIMAADLSLLITESYYFFDLDFYSGDAFSIDLELTEEDASGFESAILEKNDIAYIIYTSGSTGEPKGVLNTHGGILNTMLFQKEFFEVSSCENVAQFASFSFDASISEIFMTLLSGKSLHILSDLVRKDAYAFEEYVNNHSIDLVTLPPAFFSLLNIDKLQNLKGLITAGESAIIGKTKEYLKYGNFYNAYGPTETSICASVYKLEKESDLDSATIPIGKPISNTQIYILDSHRHLVPVGVIGELYISGSGLARGYLNREDLTQEKFIDNPFSEGTRMYRTGDLGRWLPDGNIEYLGRIDHQVKIRGHRIELGEIDSQVLSYSPSITNVVTEVKDHDGDKNLVVYYVSSSPVDKQNLSQYLESKLPQYMLPGFYVELENIPLTNNGKLDRKSLPEVSSTDVIKNEYVAARNEEENVLISICEQVLKHRPISIRDNYYNLGGDSIKSIQIVSRLRQQGYSLKVEHILQYPVLEELSRYITTDIVKIDQSAVTGESVLTPIQRYFFESEDIVNKNHYNQSVILKSTERLSVSALETTIKHLVDHHDALRMTYSQKDGVWSQYNAGTDIKNYRFNSYDLQDEKRSSEEEQERLQQIGESLQSSLDINSGILFHAGHVSMSDGDRIILVIHHLVIDGVSWRILLEDLDRLYDALDHGLSPVLPSKTDSFQSWGKVLDEYSSSQSLSKERCYWEQVESEQYKPFSTDYPVSGKHTLGASLSFSLSAESTKLLQTRAGRKYNAEINDILLTGLALSLQDQFGVNKTKILMEGHGRETMNTGLDISRTIGWFTSVYPFSLDISNTSQPALVSIKEGLRNLPHKGIGYGILHYLKENINSGSKPSVLFNYLGDFNELKGREEAEKAHGTSLFSYSSENIGSSVAPDNLPTDILLDVSGMTVNGIMNISIRFSDKVFKEDRIKAILSSYQTHLESMVIESKDSEVMLTPSDLTYKGLSFNTISEISKENDIEDIYELSPMQQGLYYHWMVAPKGLSYFMQTSYRIKASELDLSLIEKAFGILLNRYTILRTSFDNRYGEVPLQIVHKEACVDFKHLILASEPELGNIKQEDLDRGFNLSEPTQMRLLVVELPDGYFEFIWSHHHIIMDGWCLSILINDFTAILQSLESGESPVLPEAGKYSTYINWLDKVDKDSTLEYWRDYLSGVSTVTHIPFGKQKEENTTYDLSSHVSFVDHRVYKELVQFCQDLGITLNTYVQMAWSYLLSSYNHSEDVVFGAVVSGRPPEVPGIESMIGLFINTIPVRVTLNQNETLRSLLEKMHHDSIKSTDHHYLSLADIQLKSTLKGNLINHILIFENFLMNNDSAANDKDSNQMTVEKSSLHLQTTYDFNFEILPTNLDMRILVDYNKNIFDDYSVANIVKAFEEILVLFKDNIDLPLHEIKDKLEKQSVQFKAIVQKDIKEIITSIDTDLIKQKNSKKLSAFIKK